MGRPALNGSPGFRFLPTEIADMENALEENNGLNPSKETISLLAEKFSASPERVGKITIQGKQIWNWFQNRRHAQRAKSAKMSGDLYFAPSSYDDAIAKQASANSSAPLSEDTGLLLLEDQQSKGEEEDMPDRGFTGRRRGRGRGRGRGKSHSQVGREDTGLLPLEDQRAREDMGPLLLGDQQPKCEEEDTPDRASVGRHRGRGRGRGRGRTQSQVGREDTGLLLLEDQQSKGEEEDMPDRGFTGRRRGRGCGRGRGKSHSQVGREDTGLLPLEDQRSREDMGPLLLGDQRPKCEEEDTPDRASVGRHRGRGRGRGRGRTQSQVGRGRKAPGSPKMEFEARSARDMAWYDVAGFLTHRDLDPDDPEVQVRFAGFGAEEDEWVNVKTSVRHRSLPCEVSECVAVLPGDLILCFQEGKTQALYYDAHVENVKRKQHDIRGCRCRFWVRYDHDGSKEVVPLRKVCRRPETDFRLQGQHASKRSLPVEYGQGPQQIEDSSPHKDSLVMPEVVKRSGDFMDPNKQHACTEMISMDIARDTPISVIPIQSASDTAAILNEKGSNPSTSLSMIQILASNTEDVEMKPTDE